VKFDEKRMVPIVAIYQEDSCSEALLWNTILFFQYKGYSDNLLYTLIASSFLKNNISPDKVKNFLSSTINVSLCEKTIKKHLKRLHLLGYIWKSKKWGYQLKSQKHATFLNTKDFNWDIQKIKSFYDTKFLLTDETFDKFEQSKFKNFKLFIFSEVLSRLYWNEAITKDRIHKELHLNDNEVRELTKGYSHNYLFSKINKANGDTITRAEINPEYLQDQAPNAQKTPITADWEDENEYLYSKRVKINIGNVYTKDHFEIKANINEWVREKFSESFDDTNYIDVKHKERVPHSLKCRIIKSDNINTSNCDDNVKHQVKMYDSFLLLGEHRTPFGIKHHTSIDSLTGGYITRNSKEHYQNLAQESFLSKCNTLTRFLDYNKDERISKDNDLQMLAMYSDLIYHNVKYQKHCLFDNVKKRENWAKLA